VGLLQANGPFSKAAKAMRQIWISKAGPPEVLQVREAPDPHPAAGEMRIRVEASGVNFADIMGRLGFYPDLPRMPVVPGYEVAGRVDAVGAGVDSRSVGRDVFALTRFGGYADVVCVPEAQLFPRPPNMSAEHGASIPVNYLTAWQLIVVMGGLKAGETALIHSAGGGVGIAAAQIAKHIGAKVIGAASAGKHKELSALGVDHLIDYRTEDFEQRVRQITGGRGVELILDPVGGDSFKKGYRLLAPTGRLGMFGASSAATGKAAGYRGMASMLINTPWPVQSALADERQQGSVRRQPRPHVGRVRPHAGLDGSTSGFVGSRRDQAEDRSGVQVRRSPGGASFHSGPQEHRQGAAQALAVRL
jgi:NADPH:quinone reductase-like Zn-dependent oxidoreductase